MVYTIEQPFAKWKNVFYLWMMVNSSVIKISSFLQWEHGKELIL